MTDSAYTFALIVDEVAGIAPAMKYMRLPMEAKSDTGYHNGLPQIGPRDRQRSEKLIHSGDSHAKHMRMIWTWMTIRAPRYWWQELVTYKVGLESLSESTMHTFCLLYTSDRCRRRG